MTGQDTSDPEKASAPPPRVDGGLQGWLTVLGGWLMQFSTFGYVYSFGVFQGNPHVALDYYTRVYLTKNTPSDIGWIGGVTFMLACGLGLVSGKLFDMGYFYVTQVAGAALYIFCIFMLSLAKQDQFYQIFLSQGVGMGLAIGLTLVPTLGVIVHHFLRTNRALATGIALSGGGCGGIVFPIREHFRIFKLLLKHSFAYTVRASGYVVIGCMALSLLLMRAKPLPATPSGTVQPKALSFFKEIPFVLHVISYSSFLTLSGVYFPIFFMQLFAVQHKIDNDLAFYSLAIINAASVFGRICGNYLSDVFGAFTILVPTAIITASTIWALLGVHDRGSLVVVSIFYGIFSGAAFSLIAAATASLAKSPREIGCYNSMRNGLTFAIGGIALLISGPIQGALVGTTFTWTRAVAYSAVRTLRLIC
ncbi:major facilitator superfamily domain-containing protein [Collybia nuda]|uniref:Major facilitator superfamily domain-containing protein n=1 Tax=Collybia nuda TaxID=64659 RepID=A0A9P5YJG3_9AGAR|nr:major facilitator superfamily domain-containing protein [Collybia nuda]